MKLNEEENKVPYLKPQNFDEVCKLDINCDANCDVCCQLPYHAQTGCLNGKKTSVLSTLSIKG